MPSTRLKQDPCPTALTRMSRGFKLGLPIFLGYVPVGVAFGIVANGLGFTPIQALVCSATALAGAGQFIGLAMMKSGATVATVILATTVVNLRYVLFGAALSPYLSRTGVGTQALLAFTLTDETFAVNIDDHRQGKADAWSMAGVGAIAWIGWILGTGIGALAAGLIGDPSRWGVQFAMPAMFTALLVAQVEDRRHVVIGLVAAALAVALMFALPGRWYVVATPILAAAVGAAIYR